MRTTRLQLKNLKEAKLGLEDNIKNTNRIFKMCTIVFSPGWGAMKDSFGNLNELMLEKKY
jgi:hypothetical protein